MKYSPKTKEEIQDAKLIPKGIYQFEVFRAEDKMSKKAEARGETEDDMIEVELYVFVGEKERIQKDWLGTWDGGEEKLAFFCEATGQPDAYKLGTLVAADCLNQTGYLEITHKDSDQYGKQSQVRQYLPAEGVEAAREAFAKREAKGGSAKPAPSVRKAAGPVTAPVAPITDEDVPF